MKKELNNFISSNVKFDEVKLFQELKRILSHKYQTTFIYETHKQYVEFTSKKKCNVKRELSDLWIITYSKKVKKAKMTFLQAKLERKKKKNYIPFKFKGDYFQFELLAYRPNFTNKNKFNFPSNILSSSISDSVGSFGIFYYDAKSKIDFAFSVASNLDCSANTNCNTKNISLSIKNLYKVHPQYKICRYNEIEMISTIDADTFEHGLLNLMIGTPIESDLNLLKFLNQYFQGLKNNGASDFIDFINLTIGIAQNDNSELSTRKEERNPNILLLNVDLQD